MVREARIHTTVLIIEGLLMIGLGLTLFWVSTTMTNIFFEATGSIVAVLITAMGLLLVGVIDCIAGLAVHRNHRRELHVYLLLGITSLVAGLFFWLSTWGSVQLLALLAGLQGLVWGGWDLHFASRLHAHPRERMIMRILGGITILLGLLLIAGMELTSRGALVLLAGYSTYIGIYILMIGLYIHRPWKKVLPLGTRVDPLARTPIG
ncbi:MAG: hypothetical protein ACYCPM_08100 [Acidobacteriaceae bacterium]